MLTGTEVHVETAGGNVIVYRFMDYVEGLEVGSMIFAGQVIGYVAEPTGNEYKDGPHVHLEIRNENGESVDPKEYLDYEVQE